MHGVNERVGWELNADNRPVMVFVMGYSMRNV
jgi:hypothetical protein